MLSALSPVFDPASRHGAFLQTCFVHVVEDVDISWSSTTIGGQTQEATFAAWYYGSSTVKKVAIDGVWGSGTGCYGSSLAWALLAQQRQRMLA